MSGPRWPDIDPGDLGEDGEPLPGYSSPCLDTSFHDHEFELDRDQDPDACTARTGHRWVYTGTAYGGDDERYMGEGRCYCEHCGADGDA
jgi:hypothetical protein